MSLTYRTEKAFANLLEDVGVGALQVLASQESSATTLEIERVIIQALRGPQVTPKSRNVRMQVLVHIETGADPIVEDDEEETEIDPEARAQTHCANVDLVTEALLERTDLREQLSALGPDDFTCFGVTGEGQVYIKPDGDTRVIRDTLAFTCTVAQHDST